MFPNEYLNREHHKDLMREAQQARLAHTAHLPAAPALTQWAGHTLLKLGARFAVEDDAACYTVETQHQIVTVCPAA